MKLALAQANPTIGDIRGNLKLAQKNIQNALKNQCDLVIFSELFLTGYPPRDLVEDPLFVARNLEALRQLAAETGDIGVVIGFVDHRSGPSGRPIANAVALLHRGHIVAVRHKTLLPTYDVFDEGRHFEPARDNAPVVFKNTRLGLTICEDMWNVPGFCPRGLYLCDPVARLAASGADLLINISSSPFHRRKGQHRLDLVRRHVAAHRRPFILVNQVGGNDELIFDGHSFAVNADGAVLGQARAFREDLLVIETSARPTVWRELDDVAEVEEALILGLHDYVRKCNFKKTVIGLSGGIDSAVTATLAVRALGKANVLGVLMPSEFSSRGSITDALALARNLGIKTVKLPITPVFKAFKAALRPAFKGLKPDVTEENLQARIRGTLLMALSNKTGALLLSTGNKSELSMGYCTLYGDMNGGLAVISDVPKTLVYKLGRQLNRPREVIPEASFTKPPSAELRPNQTDQDSLPPYETLDGILEAYVEEQKDIEAIVAMGYDRALVTRVLNTIDRNEYKRRQAAPGLRITPKAFGMGRRLPIARGTYR